ncbi:MAG: flagellin [Clostridiales bacterium]|nr:flagellin [Clostridiales bacterium]
MIVQHNISSMNANRQLGIVGNNLAKATEKLSSGYRINRAADDAAGLSISEKMRGQVRGLQRASDNAQDGISLIQTAEGAMDQQHAILQRARELAVQAANDTNVAEDRNAISEELKALEDEFTRIKDQTEFNTQKLLNGSFTNKNFQVGANNGQSISVSITTTTMTAISGSVSTHAAATGAIATIDGNITALSTQRSKLGAIQNRLEYTVKNDDNAAENIQNAESRIRDVDMADEMTRFSKESILQQAATSMLAQANQANQGVLSLLQ